MTYYRKCPDCGAALDPSERCDCTEKKKAADAGTSNGKTKNSYKKYSARKRKSQGGKNG